MTVSGPSPQSGTGYLPEVNGLRAWAVGLVVLYHLGVPQLPGGFVGVDVFFVISGFLITRLLVAEWERTGRIRLGAFYMRRIRRILPSLFAVTLATLAVGPILLSVDRLEELAWSAIWSALSASNLYFWTLAGYFDASAIYKPLLHTWSLGVEEQFYLVWPSVVIGSLMLLRGSRRTLLAAIVLLGTVSFLANLSIGYGWITLGKKVDQAATVFFLPMFRVFEFAIGAALVSLPQARPGPWAETLCLAGMAAILSAGIVLDEAIIFPGVPALLPCVGTALVIRYAPTAFAGRLLRDPVSQYLGRISYPLYLVHWPLLSYFFFALFREPDLVEGIALLALMILLAHLLHRTIETPLRQGPLAPARRVLAWTLPVLTFVVAGAFIADGGLGWRIPDDRSVLTARQYRDLESTFCTLEPVDPALVDCEAGNPAGPTVVVWGDSHARHLIPGLVDALPGSHVELLYLSSCMAQSGFQGFFYDYEGRTELAGGCVERNRLALDRLRAAPAPSLVLLASYQRDGIDDSPEFAAATHYVLDRLRAAGHRAMLVQDVIRPDRRIADCFAVPGWLPDSLLDRRCRVPETDAIRQIATARRLQESLGPADFLRTDDVFCTGSECRTTLDGQLLFRDEHHLTVVGSRLFVSGFASHLAGPAD